MDTICVELGLVGMLESLGLIMAVLGFVLPIVDLVRVWRQDSAVVHQVWRPMLAYAFFCGLGIVAAIALVGGTPHPPDKALALTLALLAWIGWGALWLVHWLRWDKALSGFARAHFGWPDLALIAVIAGGIVVYAK